MLKHKQESPLPPHQAREAAIQINKWLCRLLRDGWTSGLPKVLKNENLIGMNALEDALRKVPSRPDVDKQAFLAFRARGGAEPQPLRGKGVGLGGSRKKPKLAEAAPISRPAADGGQWGDGQDSDELECMDGPPPGVVFTY